MLTDLQRVPGNAPPVIAERFILGAVSAGRELAAPLAAAGSEGAGLKLPGHVL